jgi:hypothetical protein
MIKWFKNLFCKIINVKQCECPEPEVLVIKEKPKHCSGHNRFRKSCPLCQEIVA